jgi:type I restriction enzyme S subunit
VTTLGWAPALPPHWQTVPLNFVARMGTGHTPDRSKPEYWENCTIPWITLTDASRRADSLAPINDTYQHISEIGMHNSAAVLHPANTVVLSRTASVGHSARIGRPMATSQDFAAWTCGDRLDPRYLLIVLRAMKPEWDRMAFGSTHRTIYMPDLESLRIPLPPVQEQRRIANFLDSEVRRLTLIEAARRKQVELLQQRRFAIAREILSGTDTSGSRTSSHVHWLSSSPSHWNWQRLSRVTQCLDGRRVPLSATERADRSGPYPYYGSSSIVDHIDDFLFDEPLVLFGEDGAQLANPYCEIAFAVAGRLWVNNHAHVLRPTGIDAKFLAIVLNIVDRQICMSGSTREKITQDDMNSLIVPVPPDNEQIDLVERIEEAFSGQAQLLMALNDQLGLLAERRQALITAAVTGQVDVSTAKGVEV